MHSDFPNISKKMEFSFYRKDPDPELDPEPDQDLQVISLDSDLKDQRNKDPGGFRS